MQDGINVQVGKSHKINKRAGWNKAVQVGIFHFLTASMTLAVLGITLSGGEPSFRNCYEYKENPKTMNEIILGVIWYQ